MKRFFIAAMILCMAMPGLAMAQQKESPFQVYSKDQSAANFVSAYNAYESQRKDSVNDDATAMLAWLNFYELEKNLDVLKAKAANLSNKNKFQYANILLELGRYDDAITLYSQLNEKTPKWSCPWRHKGTALWKKRKYDEAVTSLNKAIETRKEHYDAYVILAQVYRDKKEYKKGAATLEEGMQYYGKDVEDPEKDQSSLDVQFLYLDLLKKAGETRKYEEQRAKLEKLAPNDERLKQ